MAIYIKIKGIDGQVTSKKFTNAIQIDSVDWYVQRSIQTKVGNTADRESSTPQISEITITKLVDKTSPLLFKQVCTIAQADGDPGSTDVVISFTKTNTDVEPYLELTLAQVVFSSYVFNSGGEENPERPTETLTLNFTAITMNVTPVGAEGKDATPIRATYDLSTGEAS